MIRCCSWSCRDTFLLNNNSPLCNTDMAMGIGALVRHHLGLMYFAILWQVTLALSDAQ